MILDEILKAKEQELERSQLYFPIEDLKRKIAERRPPKDFFDALMAKQRKDGGIDEIRIIAEVKQASPSKGLLVKGPFYPFEVAKLYRLGGAAAVSVITEEKFFKGRLDFLPAISQLNIPVLRKDFLLSEYQVYESRANGADALLLIVALLDKARLKGLIELTESLGMCALVEVHDEAELATAIDAGATLIGVNNRDLKTFKTDINTTIRLAPLVPSDRLLVSESGINTHEEIKTLMAAGVGAFLIGEALIREENIIKKLKELRGIGQG